MPLSRAKTLLVTSLRRWLSGGEAPVIVHACETCQDELRIAPSARGRAVRASFSMGNAGKADVAVVDRAGAPVLLLMVRERRDPPDLAPAESGLCPSLVVDAAALAADPIRLRPVRFTGLPLPRCRCARSRVLRVIS